MSKISLAVQKSWEVPYRQGRRSMILDSINSSRNENIGRAYSNSASMIQGTAVRDFPVPRGTGKSRTADEMAKEVFTIPLNVRNPAEDKNGR